MKIEDPACCNWGQVQPNKHMQINIKKENILGFPGGPVFKNPPCNVGNMGLIPGPGRFHMLWNN